MQKVGTILAAFLGDSQQKYESRHKILSSLALRLGFRLYNRNLTWHEDREYIEIWKKFPEADQGIHERRFNLFQLARAASEIEGETAECGSFRGAGSFLILSASRDINFVRKHHIFDSFEGLSKPIDKDISGIPEHTFKWNQNDMSCDETRLRQNLAAFDNVEYYKGWIPERFHEVADLKFSLVRIDVDLHQPTLDSLKFFYPRMNKGGFIICDDYGFASCPGARKAFDEFFADKPQKTIHLTTGQGLVVV